MFKAIDCIFEKLLPIDHCNQDIFVPQIKTNLNDS